MRGDAKLDFSKRCDHILTNEWIIVTKVQKYSVAQICTLCKEHKVFQVEHTLNDLVRLVRTLDLVVAIRQDGLLLAKITLALENQLVLDVLYFNIVGYIVHVANELHKIV